MAKGEWKIVQHLAAGNGGTFAFRQLSLIVRSGYNYYIIAKQLSAAI